MLYHLLYPLAGDFGLFNIQQRLEPLGGRLEIVSAPGQGSRFALWAPLQRARAAASPEAVRPSRPENSGSPPGTALASPGSPPARYDPSDARVAPGGSTLVN